MKRNNLLISTCLLFITLTGFGQSTLIWHFGQTARMDFTQLPVATSCGSALVTQEGSSGLTTNTGQDLFYTDGRTVWNRNNVPMPNGNGTLAGDASSTSSAIIVPDPADSLRYYVFTTDQEEDQATGAGFNHYIVDMSLNGGLGDVIIPAGNPIHDVASGLNYPTEKLTAIPNADNSGYWIITVPFKGQNTFYSYLLTSTGLNFTPVSSSVGLNLHSQGYIKPNLTGSKIAVASRGFGVEILDFNRFTGQLSNPLTLYANTNELHYGVEFSPDGNVLYTSSLFNETFGPGQLYKYDLTAANIPASRTSIYSNDTEVGALSIGPNGKIYFAHNNGNWDTHLGVIDTPNDFNAPNVIGDAVLFPCGSVFRGLPTSVPGLILPIGCTPPTSASITSSPGDDFCEGETVTLTANSQPGYVYFWIDEGTGDTVSQGIDVTTYQVSGDGAYHVIIADIVDVSDAACTRPSNSLTLDEHELPDVSAVISGPDTVCQGATGIDYSYSSSFDGYNWSTTNASLTGGDGTSTGTFSFAGSNVSQNAVIRLTVEEQHGVATCTSEEVTKTVVIEVAEAVEVSPSSQIVACEQTGTVTIVNYDPNSSYEITSESNISVDAITSATVTFTTSTIDGSFVIVETTSNGCSNSSQSVSVDVRGCGINADIQGENEQCSGLDVSLNDGNSTGGTQSVITSWEWILPVELTGSPTNQSTIDLTASNLTPTPIDVVVRLVVTNNVGLTDTATYTVTINPTPGNHIIDSNGMVCQDSTGEYSATPYDENSTYHWSTSRNAAITVDSSVSYNNGTTDYTVFVFETNEYSCVGPLDSLEVEVELSPEVIFNVNDFQVACRSTGNEVIISNYNSTSSYDIEPSIPSITFTRVDSLITFSVDEESGFINVTEITDPNGCGSDTKPIRFTVVGCALTANFGVDISSPCSGDLVTFTSNSDPGGNPPFTIEKYTWTFPQDTVVPVSYNADSSIVEAMVFNAGSTPINVSVSLFIRNSIALEADTLRIDVITINPTPVDVIIDTVGSICEGGAMEFVVTNPEVGVNYNWEAFGNVASFSSVSDSAVAVNGTQDYFVTVQAESVLGGCVSAIDTAFVEVETTPSFSLTPADQEVACNGSAEIEIVTYDSLSNYQVIGLPTGASQTRVDGIYTIDVAETDGQFTVQQTTQNGCVSPVSTANIDVIGCDLTVDFNLTSDACNGDTITIISSSVAGEGDSIVNYNWELTPAQNIITSPTNNDTIQVVVANNGDLADSIQVQLTVTTEAGLSGEETKENIVIVKGNPEGLSISATGGSCEEDETTFEVSPFDPSSTYIWSSSASQVTASGNNAVYINAETNYNVTVTEVNANKCPGEPETLTRVIDERPNNFSISGPDAGCPFITGLQYGFSASANNATSYQWTTLEGLPDFFVTSTTLPDVRTQLPNNPRDTITVQVTIGNEECAWDTMLTHNIVIDTTYFVKYSLLNPEICLDDNMDYLLQTEVVDFDGDITFAEMAANIWEFNEDTVAFDTNHYFVDPLQVNDHLEVYVNPTFCYTVNSVLSDSIMLNMVTRPGGTLLINGDSIEHTLSGIYTIPQITLTDTLETKRQALGWDSPLSWQWLWYDVENDTLISDGIPFPTTVNHTTIATPPSYDEDSYSVEYYMVTYNGVCYDTSIAILNIDFDIFIPDAFSPNNDNSHDVWVITNLEKYPGASAQIYNRWGNLVAELDDIATNPWDGTRDGKELPMGTYFFLLTVEEGTEAIPGDVSILR